MIEQDIIRLHIPMTSPMLRQKIQSLHNSLENSPDLALWHPYCLLRVLLNDIDKGEIEILILQKHFIIDLSITE
jgi:hypothetical protein